MIKTKAFQLWILSRTLNTKHRLRIGLSLDRNLDVSKSFCFIVIVSLLLFSLLLFHCYCFIQTSFFRYRCATSRRCCTTSGSPPTSGSRASPRSRTCWYRFYLLCLSSWQSKDQSQYLEMRRDIFETRRSRVTIDLSLDCIQELMIHPNFFFQIWLCNKSERQSERQSEQQTDSHHQTEHLLLQVCFILLSSFSPSNI